MVQLAYMDQQMSDILDVARLAGRKAATIVREAWDEARRVEHKGPVDLVTTTDREAETAIVSTIRNAFPDHRIVAEEGSGGEIKHPPPGAPTWYVDPLDGTVNFVHQVPHCAISVAFASGTDVRVAVVIDPLRDEEFCAIRGAGATLNGRPIRVSGVAQLSGALLATGLPYDRRDYADYYLRFGSDFVHQAQDVRRFGSAALDLCWVACGRYDGFWEWRLHAWDVAAGSLIVCEAGGRVSDFRGQPLDLFGEQIVAANPDIHPSMCAVLERRLATEPHPEQGS